VEEESIVVLSVEDLGRIQASDMADRDCRERIQEEGQRPRSFGEGLATFPERTRSLILNSKYLVNDGGDCDVFLVFFADYRFEIEEFCPGLYGNVCRQLYRPLQCRVL